MCVIIDACLAGPIFNTPSHCDFIPLWDWILRKDGCIVFGGKLATELEKVKEGARQLQQLSASGKARRVKTHLLNEEEANLKAKGLCKSDDPHVIALARVSRARVLCSRDKALHADFTNPNLISRPRGRVYQNATHAKVLGHTPGCIGRPKK
jgi:hypothetical protein